MAPLKPIKGDTNESRVQSVLDTAQKIADTLKDRNQIPKALQEELNGHIKRSLPLPASAALASKSSSFDHLGCELWNAATNLLRQDEHQPNPHNEDDRQRRLLALLRVFAFFLVDSAHQPLAKQSVNSDQRLRNFKVALKACRFCLDGGELALAQRVLERCSEYVSAVENDAPLIRMSEVDDHDEHGHDIKTLVTEFYLLRFAHAWKVDRIDLAEHHYSKIPASQLSKSSNLAEKAADLFFEAGKSLSKQKQHDSAIRWLERAIGALDSCGLEDQSEDARELRLSITSYLVECLLKCNEHTATKRASDLVEELSTVHGFGNRLTVQLLNFETLVTNEPVDLGKLTKAVSRVLRSAVLTDRTFKSIMRTIHRTRQIDVVAACSALSELIIVRLLDDYSDDEDPASTVWTYIEKASVTYVLFVTKDQNSSSTSIVNQLQETLDSITRRTAKAFSPKATHAIQTLMWKAAGVEGSTLTDRWCRLMQHPLFENAGLINKARISRKIMATALARKDFDEAKSIFLQMPTSIQNESATRYLAFKTALRTNDRNLANASLEEISKQASNDQSFLYACVLEAQQSSMRAVAIAGLQAILDKRLPNAHLPSLLRCTACLLIGELDGEERNPDEVMEEVVRVFEHAAANVQAFRKGSDDQCRAELQWWSKSAYNLSLKRCHDIDPSHLVRLLDVCVKFIHSYAPRADKAHQDDIRRRQALCHFLCATALIVLARREEEGFESNLQSYLQAGKHIEEYMSLEPDSLNNDKANFPKKTFELLKFRLECILNLQQWDQLDAALKACLECKDVDRWSSLADIVLIIRQRVNITELDDRANSRTNELLDRIVNDTWKKDRDITKVARWLRLSFSMDMSDSNGDFALKLLKQAAEMAKKGYEKQTLAYPEMEIQWLSTTAFNRAIDLLSSGDTQTWTAWVDGALELARYAADNGALHANLSEKRGQVMAKLEGKMRD